MSISKARLLTLGLLAASLLVFVSSITVQAQAEVDPETLQLGAQVYLENCALCHGETGQGRVGATLAKDWPSIRPDLAVRQTIIAGVPGSVMPAWAQENGGPLNDNEIEAVVIYILSWETGGLRDLPEMPTPTPRPLISPVPEVQGDPNQGAILYDLNCAVCHGENGQGRVGATLAKSWASIRPDLTIKTTIARGVPGSTMPAWSQENGGPLSEGQINDIVAYILSWQVNRAGSADQEPATPTPQSWLTGPGGVLLFVVLFGILIAAIWFAQGQRKETE